MRKKIKKKAVKSKVTLESDPLITVIILCDLPGYRMKSYGSSSLTPINKKFLIDLQIDCIVKRFTKYEIIVCVGFDGERISKHIRSKYKDLNIRIVENQIFPSCNSCEGIRLSINNTLNDKILIIDGSLLIHKKTLALIDITKNCTLIEKIPSENLEIGVNINQNHIAEHFSFGACKTWSEILYIHEKEAVSHIMKYLNHQDCKKKFIFEALNDLIKNNFLIQCIENKNTTYKINNIKTYHNIRENHEIFNI